MKTRLVLCVTGSFCSMDDLLYVLKQLNQYYEIDVFMTPHVYTLDTRFNTSQQLKDKITDIIHKDIHYSINDAETYGPDKKADIVLVYPCDANTLNKIDNGINDNCVTMVIKSCLRNRVPVVMGVYSNDFLSNSGIHFMSLLNKKNFYFVPVYQDDYINKPFSLTADRTKVKDTLSQALLYEQIQPLLLGYKEIE